MNLVVESSGQLGGGGVMTSVCSRSTTERYKASNMFSGLQEVLLTWWKLRGRGVNRSIQVTSHKKHRLMSATTDSEVLDSRKLEEEKVFPSSIMSSSSSSSSEALFLLCIVSVVITSAAMSIVVVAMTAGKFQHHQPVPGVTIRPGDIWTKAALISRPDTGENIMKRQEVKHQTSDKNHTFKIKQEEASKQKKEQQNQQLPSVFVWCSGSSRGHLTPGLVSDDQNPAVTSSTSGSLL